MTKEILSTLTTGDFIKNTKTDQICMISMVSPNISSILTIENIIDNLDDWELSTSRLTITKEQKRMMEEYHEKVRKAMDTNGYHCSRSPTPEEEQNI